MVVKSFQFTSGLVMVEGNTDTTLTIPQGEVSLKFGPHVVFSGWHFLDPVRYVLKDFLFHGSNNRLVPKRGGESVSIQEVISKFAPLASEECLDGASYYVFSEEDRLVVVIQPWDSWGDSDLEARQVQVLSCYKTDFDSVSLQFNAFIESQLKSSSRGI